MMFVDPAAGYIKTTGQVSGGVGATYTGGTFLVGINATLSSGSSTTVTIATASNQIVLDSPIVNSNSGDLTFESFEGTAYTGGTPLQAYINDRNSTLTPDVNDLVVDAAISDIGTLILPAVQTVGDNAAGRARSFNLGYPLILKPNTNYTLRVTHNDGQNRQVNLYIAAFRRR